MVIKALPFLISFTYLYFLKIHLPNKQFQRLNKEADVAARSKGWACGRSLAKPAIGSVVCLQVEVSATDRSLLRKRPTNWCVRQSVIENLLGEA